MMRGYYSGRYREENLLAAQAEFRYRLIPKLGFVAFAGAGSVYQSENLELRNFKPSYGGGMRYFFDVERGLSIRLDYGLGEKRANEERQKGFYVSLGEAF
jgi:outer membrane translocation and assembly module TamA